MRSLPWPEHRFERVISWFTSFSYFDDIDNQKVLSAAHRVLRPGGRLLIEYNNLAELLPRWLPAVVVERDGDFMIDRSTFEPATGRAVTERTCVGDGHVRRFSFSVRMFIAVELKGWLLAAGFDSVDQVDHEGAALAAGSGRMVSVAHKASGCPVEASPPGLMQQGFSGPGEHQLRRAGGTTRSGCPPAHPASAQQILDLI
jgi:SAM-dependent methyltransferase